MDFWSRLIGGSRFSPLSKSLRTSAPEERLTAFKRTCHSLQQIWRTGSVSVDERALTTQTRNCIERLNAVLAEETRGPAPHPCLIYASSSQIYITVTKLALTTRDESLIQATAALFNTLVDAEVEGIVDNRIFARALVDLVRRSPVLSEEVELRLVELLFGVANNIRLQPAILSAWFNPKGPCESSGSENHIVFEKRFAGATRKDDFPLFYFLVDYIHREGRSGDFARTGLLYIIETASRSRELEKWLIESDLATLMATSLGALYSQLNRNLSTPTEGTLPTIIALSDECQAEMAIQPRLGADMDSFLSHLLFWQDTINHCRSAEVNDTLLDHFQVLFLQQLLYPSLLESSDVAGGSTPAVLTHLYRLLEAIDQPELIHRILHFLLASPSIPEPPMEVPAPCKHMSLSRRKSLDLLAAFAEEAANPSPSLFNLADLILMSIKSQNRETVVATLRLVTVILRRHHSFVGSLIQTASSCQLDSSIRTVGALNAELRQLWSLSLSIVDDATLDESFDNYLKDAAMILESRLCVDPPLGTLTADGLAKYPLAVQPDDAILRGLLNHLQNFFTNGIVTNLALTEALASLVSSNLISLSGWLLVEPRKYDYDLESSPQVGVTSDTGPGHDMIPKDIMIAPLTRVKLAYSEPTWSSENTPPLPAVLRRLVDQIHKWRCQIPDFDLLATMRWQLLHHEDRPIMEWPPDSRQPSEPRPLRVSMERPPQRAARPDIDSGSPRGRRVRTPEPSDQSALRSAPGSLSRSAVASPLRESFANSPPSSPRPKSEVKVAEDLQLQLQQPVRVAPLRTLDGTGDVDARSDRLSIPLAKHTLQSEVVQRPVTLNHVLTNVVILHEFILELIALVQVRANMLGEVGYSR